MAKGNKPNQAAFTFELVSALMFVLLLAYTVLISPYPDQFGALARTANGFWLPVVYGLAAVGTITLFAISFTNLTSKNPSFAYSMHVSLVNGFAWMVLSVGNGPFAAFAAVAMGLSIVGSIMGLSEAAN